MKKILYIDMDNTLVDFQSGEKRMDPEVLASYNGKDHDDIPGIFALMAPMPHAITAVEFLKDHFDLYILSTAPWKNPTCFSRLYNFHKSRVCQ